MAGNTRHPYWQLAVLVIAWLSWLAAWVFHAHITQDAYVTFRVADNFLQGYGLRFNIYERVQAYTNPLWLLIHIPFYALYRNIEAVTLALSLACAIGSPWLVAKTFRLSPPAMAIFLLLPLSLSFTLSAYFSSGLEDPLSLFLFAWFGYELWPRADEPRWFWLIFIVSLSLVNRLDTVLVYAPALTYLFLNNHGRVPWRKLWAGALPIIIWESFSLLYYGFLFPNTKYAKLNTGVPEREYLKHGVGYLTDFLYADPVIACLLVAIIAYMCAYRLPRVITSFSQLSHKEHLALMLCLGMVFYIVYVICVGGSYMTCLFLTLPAFMALWLALAEMPAFRDWKPYAIGAAVMLFIYDISWLPAWQKTATHMRNADHLLTLNSGYTLLGRDNGYRLHLDALLSPHPSQICNEDASQEYHVMLSMLRYKLFEGPCINLIDRNALSDPLLARLPAQVPVIIRQGHITRKLPEGYLLAIETGSTYAMNPSLAEYYKPLRLIVSGDIWDWERLRTILRFNAGQYDIGRNEYLAGL